MPWPQRRIATPSQNQLALVRFAGHLRIWQTDSDEDVKYLDLNLERVRYFLGANGYSHLALDADCSTVEIEVSRDEKLKIFRVKRIMIRPHFGGLKYCHIYPDDIFFAYEQYWSCSQTKVYYCTDIPTESSSSPRRVAIVFNQLELELDGDPEKIAQHRFDKLKVECP